MLVFAVAANMIAGAGAPAVGVLDDRVGPKAVIVGSLIGLVVTVTMLLFLGSAAAMDAVPCGYLQSQSAVQA